MYYLSGQNLGGTNEKEAESGASATLAVEDKSRSELWQCDGEGADEADQAPRDQGETDCDPPGVAHHKHCQATGGDFD